MKDEFIVENRDYTKSYHELMTKLKDDSASYNSYRKTVGILKTPFIGGSGDNIMTLHERIFAYMFPEYKTQVVFGTGAGGYKKYGVKKYTADFYHEELNKIIEIDGNSHRYKDSLLDYNRDHFFHSIGITTNRIYHDHVEYLLFLFMQDKERFENWRLILLGR